MATLTIREFLSMTEATHNPTTPTGNTGVQTMAPTKTSQQSNPVSQSTGAIAVTCDVPVFISLGSNPTADATGLVLTPGQEVASPVAPGVTKVACLLQVS